MLLQCRVAEIMEQCFDVALEAMQIPPLEATTGQIRSCTLFLTNVQSCYLNHMLQPANLNVVDYPTQAEGQNKSHDLPRLADLTRDMCIKTTNGSNANQDIDCN